MADQTRLGDPRHRAGFYEYDDRHISPRLISICPKCVMKCFSFEGSSYVLLHAAGSSSSPRISPSHGNVHNLGRALPFPHGGATRPLPALQVPCAPAPLPAPAHALHSHGGRDAAIASAQARPTPPSSQPAHPDFPAACRLVSRGQQWTSNSRGHSVSPHRAWSFVPDASLRVCLACLASARWSCG